MMRSMFSGVSGLRVHQTRMDVIANNISNVNTIGFKSSNVVFDEIFSQTLTGASAASDMSGRGGVNPMQVGLGANISSIDRVMTTGAAQRTDRAMDLMIDGDGFFIVEDNSGTFFTRAGKMDLDKDGNLVIANGMKVMGWDSVPDPNNPGQFMIQRGPVQPITVTGDKLIAPPAVTQNSRFLGNLDVTADGPTTMTKSFFDSLGNRYEMDVEFEYIIPENGDPFWEVRMGPNAYLNGDKSKPVEGIIDAPTPNPGPNGALDAADGVLVMTLDFDENGVPSFINGQDMNAENFVMPTISLDSSGLRPVANLGNNGFINLDFSDLTQHGNLKANARSEYVDGRSAGTLEGLSFNQDGILVGRYSNGQERQLGQIAVADFVNPAGLESMGGSLFMSTANSGAFDGVGQQGLIRGGVLEMSNVDLSGEFTDMIMTQRGFQASSRLITTSDDMIQELVNLKR